MTTTYVASLTVTSESEQQLTRATEVLSRAAAGLALEGLAANLTVTQFDEEEDED